jgi:hypothetical protein
VTRPYVLRVGAGYSGLRYACSEGDNRDPMKLFSGEGEFGYIRLSVLEIFRAFISLL